ncbi:hypothetical protein [Fibrobacter sp. UWB7]|uniref:hypothetical protein n=1 Tax=Fibrobacter sp. UWB7 TaxID=1896206 RepID=UPI00091BC622|nr:hypothetical protein [Fibrobacter sp. UWB7]SHM75294.1 hypothetical protein SAMN05720467_2234 [Fibrobacter sp. UWB7]
MNQTNNTAAINNLIAIAQTAVNEDVRNKAINELWGLCGDQIAGIMAGKSFQMDSDFSLKGYSPKERQDSLLGNAYYLFYNAVATFNPSLGVPFIAYTTQKSSWFLATEKRNNSKRSKREEYVDFSLECGPSTESSPEASRMMEIFKGIAHKDRFENDCYWEDAVQVLSHAIQNSPKLSKYFEASLEVCKEGDDYSDANVARYMGCTRACVGQYRKALLRMMEENGLSAEFNQLMAA